MLYLCTYQKTCITVINLSVRLLCEPHVSVNSLTQGAHLKSQAKISA